MSGIWYYRQAGQVFGPVTFEALQQLAQDGRLGANDEIRTGSDPDWKIVSTVGSLNVARPAKPDTNAIAATPETESSEIDVDQRNVEAPDGDSTWLDVLSQADSANSQAKFSVVGQTEDVNFYARIEGQEKGPLSHARVTSMLRDGRLANHDQIRSGERGDWIPIEEHPAFAVTASEAEDPGTRIETTAEHTPDDADFTAPTTGPAIDTPAAQPVLSATEEAATEEAATGEAATGEVTTGEVTTGEVTTGEAATVEDGTDEAGTDDSPLPSPHAPADRRAAADVDSAGTTAAAPGPADTAGPLGTRSKSIDTSASKDVASRQPRRPGVSIPAWCYSTRTLGIGVLSLAVFAAVYFWYPRQPPHPGVSGTVTLDGQPLANATMSFLPDDGQLEPAFARTDQQGKYTLQQTETVGGATPGSYKVRITTYEPPITESDPPVAGAPERVPTKYNIKTELAATIKKVENNVIDFPLDSNGQVVQPREVY